LPLGGLLSKLALPGLSMKKIKWIILSLVLVYSAGFFLWVPISLAGINYKLYGLTRVANNYDRMAYRSWVVPLGEKNIFFRLRKKNAVFWCDRFENCKAR
jgi:hypothetical protein